MQITDSSITKTQKRNLTDMQEKMQKFKPRMEIDPKIDVNLDARPVMPQIKPQILRKPDEMEVKAEDADIFIG